MNKSIKDQLEAIGLGLGDKDIPICEGPGILVMDHVKQLDKDFVSVGQLISFYDKVNSKPHPDAVWWNNPEYPEISDHPGNWTLHGVGASVKELRRMAQERERLLKPTESPYMSSNDINPIQHTLNENKSLNDD